MGNRSLYFLIAVIIINCSERSTAQNSRADELVSVCSESTAPFVYESIDGDQGKEGISGLHIENLALLENSTGLKLEFRLLPWKRCLYSVENYAEPGDYEIALNAAYNEERAEKFHLVGPLYTFNTAVFYSRDKHPDGPIVNESGEIVSRLSDLKDFSVCALLGWNLEIFYTKHGFPRSVKFEQTAGGFQSAFDMISNDRCDMIQAPPTIVFGEIGMERLNMPKDLACITLDEPPENFYLLVSKNSPRAEELVTKLGAAIIRLQNLGQWKSTNEVRDFPALEEIEAAFNCM